MEKIIVDIPEGTDLNDVLETLNKQGNMDTLTEENLKFDDAIYSNLPSPLNGLELLYSNPQTRDMVLLTNLTVLSAIATKLFVQHGTQKEGAQLYNYFLGNPGQGKGVINQWKEIALKYHKHLTNKYKEAYDVYLKAKKASNKEPENYVEPNQPVRKFLLLPGNISKASLYAELAKNDGYSLIFETEADMIVNAMMSNYGGFSDVLRAGLHGEPVSISRIHFGDNGPVEIDKVNISVLLTSTLNQCFSLIPTGEDGLFSRFIYYLIQPSSPFKSPYDSSNFLANQKIKEIADLFLKIGIEDKRRTEGIEFVYTDWQKSEYKAFFAEIDSKFTEQYEDKLSGNIKRMGLIFTRICMLLTFLRECKSLIGVTQIVCDQKDFSIAKLLVEKILYHLQIIHHLYETQNKKQQAITYIPSQITAVKKRVPNENVFKAIELRNKNYSFREISKIIFGDDTHPSTILKWVKNSKVKVLPLPVETDTPVKKSRWIEVERVLKSTEVSLFKNLSSPIPIESTCNLWDVLLNLGYENEIERLRETKSEESRKKLKEGLPCFTPCGVFENRRRKENLISHSNFLCIDIDGKDNEHISNFSSLILQLSKIINVAFCSRSVSGNGYFLLIPIENHLNHTDYFKAVSHTFSKLQIKVDLACSDVSRLRIISHDENYYLADTAMIIDTVMKESIRSFVTTTSNISNESGLGKLKALVQKINELQIDVTDGYKDWFHIACCLANELQEKGREYFHVISAFHPSYNFVKTENQYDACLQNAGMYKRYSLNSFFAVCKKYGLH